MTVGPGNRRAPAERRPAGRPSTAGEREDGGAGSPTFEDLYRWHYRRVLGLCRRLLRGDQAEDATQETFERAYRAFADYDPQQPFTAWILRIASNHCVDLLRRGRRGLDSLGTDPDALDDLAADDPAAITELIRTEDAAAVRAAIERLPDRQRVPLVLAYYNESSYDEIAAILGITRNHVGVLLLRAKQALRAELRRTMREAPEGDKR